NIRNKKASHDFEFLEKFVAGIQLSGTEIKSIRLGKASLTDSFCYFHNGELFVKNMHIAEYYWGNLNNHDPKRDRKLLLNKKELEKLFRRSQEKGLAIVAFHIFLNEKGLAKLEIALAKGKKEFDKREDLKQKEARREMDRAMKR
ncbi:MAG TPA: SsrA-binding protein SmpB, partial [Bacteroidales bacterium]|nr:SsrA-binding protein SmpB [Bacteroidales bacterium]